MPRRGRKNKRSRGKNWRNNCNKPVWRDEEEEEAKEEEKPIVVLEICACRKCAKSKAPVGRIIDVNMRHPLAVVFSKVMARQMISELWKKTAFINEDQHSEILHQIGCSRLACDLLPHEEWERKEHLDTFCCQR